MAVISEIVSLQFSKSTKSDSGFQIEINISALMQDVWKKKKKRQYFILSCSVIWNRSG